MLHSVAQAFRIDRIMAIAGVACLVDMVLMVVLHRTEGPGHAAAGVALAGVGWLSLGWRKRWPVPVAVVALVSVLVYFPVTGGDGPTPLMIFMMAFYAAARAEHVTTVVVITVKVMLLITYGEFVMGDHEFDINNMTIKVLSGWFLSIVAFGHAMRVRAAYLREAEQRALAAERERDVRARQSATEERLRIARELHDVLGHNISLINVQAAAAVHRSAKRPGQTEELVTALESVRDTSREALRELRSTLGVLRQVDETPTTAPTSGLDRLGELAERATTTGLQVTVTSTGEPRPVPQPISLAAYRIVQESLTNVARHAGATRATIVVAHGDGELRVSVDDDGRGTGGAVNAHGSGIAGMRERAQALGGHLTARDTGAGFRVEASWPLPAAPEPPDAGDAAPSPAPAEPGGTGCVGTPAGAPRPASVTGRVRLRE